mgnify:CR=1 FL=1
MKFNKLTCIDRIRRNNRIFYNCLCECGNYKIIRGDSIVSGHTKSCGNCPLNTYDLSNEYVIGYTQKYEKFYLDKGDYEKIRHFTWYKDIDGYIRTNINGEMVYMHRFLLEPKSNDEIDHKNHIRHDNRRNNLRVASRSQNSANKPIGINNNSGVTGVYFDKSRNKWAVQITKDGKVYSLGRYNNKKDAIKVRVQKEIELFGEFSPNYKIES